MYVWFDALVNYISATGWPEKSADFDKWWANAGDVVQYCGKDNLRQQSAMWQAMLMAAELPGSRTIVIDGFITGEGGIKMSKSLGNTIDPLELVREYGTDALRYYVCRENHPFEDSPFTVTMFKEAYNAGLANGIGNLTSRVLKLTSTHLTEKDLFVLERPRKVSDMSVFKSLAEYNIQAYCNEIWKLVTASDQLMQETQPFKLVKLVDAAEVKKGKEVLAKLHENLGTIAFLLGPIMPETAAIIAEHVKANKMPEKPLFMRK